MEQMVLRAFAVIVVSFLWEIVLALFWGRSKDPGRRSMSEWRPLDPAERSHGGGGGGRSPREIKGLGGWENPVSAGRGAQGESKDWMGEPREKWR
ncbi:hypothetical protein Aple_058670 [Acrocarpospora pleiomorpha]|uniref:Uncharacterized protein n=1 Tax=Acrocarpospora pleiomorpha TaxID=90975 RepID=A0A5M3XXE5_9ACTN|nr:hypothetical protein Aple_058670 [Acrocarpospora pleiomorpha]